MIMVMFAGGTAGGRRSRHGPALDTGGATGGLGWAGAGPVAQPVLLSTVSEPISRTQEARLHLPYPLPHPSGLPQVTPNLS